MLIDLSSKFKLKRKCNKLLYSNKSNTTTSPEDKIKKKWTEFMNDVKSKEVFNSSGATFKMIKVIKKNYGYCCVMEIPNGCKFENLESLKSEIQDSFECVIEFYRKTFTNKFLMELVLKQLNNLSFKVEEAPEKIYNPYYLFIGYSYTGKRVFIDMRDFPHLLISGKTGSGKSRLLYTILTNLFANSDEKNLNMYFCQVRKKDCSKFKNYKSTKLFAVTYTETLAVVQYLNDICKKREALIDAMGVENLHELNQRLISEGKEDKILPVIYLVLDEFSFYMVDESDDKKSYERQLKEKIQSCLYELIRVGRSNGIFLITALQRSTATNLPSNLKASMTKVTLTQNSAHESKIAIDLPGAEKLKNREGLLNKDGKAITSKVPKIIKKSLIERLDDSKDDKLELNKQEINIDEYSEDLKTNKPIQQDIDKDKDKDKNKDDKDTNSNNNSNNVIEINTKDDMLNNSYINKLTNSDKNLLKKLAEDRKSINKANQILLYMEQYNLLSIRQAEKIFYNDVERSYDRARKKLLELEKNNKIKSCKIGAEKVYYFKKEPSVHETLIMNFYSILIENKCNILEFHKSYKIFNGLIIPDAFIIFEYKGYKYNVFLEVDYSHFTDIVKLGKYEMCYNSNEFQNKYGVFPLLLILRDKKNIEFKSKKIEVIFSDFNVTDIKGILLKDNK